MKLSAGGLIMTHGRGGSLLVYLGRGKCTANPQVCALRPGTFETWKGVQILVL